MSDQFYYVSLVVSSESRIIKNELLRIDKPLRPEEALEYDQAIQEWLKSVPVPGEVYEAPAPKVVDPAEIIAGRLPKILSREGTFEEFDTDLGVERVDPRKPFDWANQS